MKDLPPKKDKDGLSPQCVALCDCFVGAKAFVASFDLSRDSCYPEGFFDIGVLFGVMGNVFVDTMGVNQATYWSKCHVCQ